MSRFNPHHPNAESVFAAAAEFRDLCLLGQRSLLLPNQPLWTPHHFEQLIRYYVDRPDVGEGGIYEKLEGQLSPCEPFDVALMTEIYWIVQLGPTNLKPPTKKRTLQRIWEMKPAGSFPSSSQFLTTEVLSGLGSGGPGYNQYLWMELVFAINAFSDFSQLALQRRQELLTNSDEFATWLDSIPSGKGRQFYHVLCHLLFPDAFERIFSQGHKNKVSRVHGIWTPGLSDRRPAQDAALLELRRRLEAQHHEQIDHYFPPVNTLVEDAPLDSNADGGVAVTPGAELHSEDPDDANESEPVFRLAENVILFGSPGTGKTWELQKRMRSAYEKGEEYVFVAFHPTYSYEDFVGGLRPTKREDDKISHLDFKAGPFLTICDKAHANPSQQFTIFIDEINRANVARVFGELITLIEPTKRAKAGSRPKETGAWIYLPGFDRYLGVPDNLNIVATMNTADRSVALMDLALRRRFRFQECRPEPGQIEPPYVEGVDLRRLLQCWNDRLEYLIDREHAIGHALFMQVNSLGMLRQVVAENVIPLFQEYFFDDLDKVRLALTGTRERTAFFRKRTLSPRLLFPGERETGGGEARSSYSVADRETWTSDDFIALYADGGGANDLHLDELVPSSMDSVSSATTDSE